MFDEIIPILFILFFTSLGLLILWKLFDIVRNSINKKEKIYDSDSFERLAKAFIEHRKDTDRRLQHIEAIITAEHSQLDRSKGSENLGSMTAGKPNEIIAHRDKNLDEIKDESSNSFKTR